MGTSTAMGFTALAVALAVGGPIGVGSSAGSAGLFYDSAPVHDTALAQVEQSSLSAVAADRAEGQRTAEQDAELMATMQAERIETAERANREAERVRLEEAAAAKAAAEAAAAAAAKAAAEAAAAAEAERIANADPRELGQILAAQRGWTGEQWSCLDSLWQRESRWLPTADNPSSSAYGIPQALPGSKMASAGPDWATNPATQITWGLGYIADRYGTPCGAWSHSESHNWY